MPPKSDKNIWLEETFEIESSRSPALLKTNLIASYEYFKVNMLSFLDMLVHHSTCSCYPSPGRWAGGGSCRCIRCLKTAVSRYILCMDAWVKSLWVKLISFLCKITMLSTLLVKSPFYLISSSILLIFWKQAEEVWAFFQRDGLKFNLFLSRMPEVGSSNICSTGREIVLED